MSNFYKKNLKTNLSVSRNYHEILIYIQSSDNQRKLGCVNKNAIKT
jgi:hypothetical protein